MSETGAIKIDLNDGINTEDENGLNLSKNQKKALIKYLESKKQGDKFGIIKISKDKIGELKKALISDGSADEKLILDKIYESPEGKEVLGLLSDLGENKEKTAELLEKKLGGSNPKFVEMIKDLSEDSGALGKFLAFILDFLGVDLDTAFNKSVVNKIKDIFNKFDDDKFNDLIIKKADLSDDFYKNLDNDKGGLLSSIKKVSKFNKQDIYNKKFLLGLFRRDGEFDNFSKNKNIINNGELDYDKFATTLNEYTKTLKEEKKKTPEEKKEVKEKKK